MTEFLMRARFEACEADVDYCGSPIVWALHQVPDAERSSIITISSSTSNGSYMQTFRL